MTPRTREALLLLRTIRNLETRQVVHRVRLRANKLVLGSYPELFEKRWRRGGAGTRGWPSRFVPLDGRGGAPAQDPQDVIAGSFTFLADRRSVLDPLDWEQRDASQLWRYNLHYYEWAWTLVSHPDRDEARVAFERLWKSWRAHTRFGRWDEWSPYVVAVRTWSMCGLFEHLVRGGDVEEEFTDALRLHAGFVRKNLERDVGGNHLVKNLKALIGAGVFLDDVALRSTGLDELRKQLDVQVLDDGGHFERSPSYHCQVLGDLIDVHELLDAAEDPDAATLQEAIAKMRYWLGAMLMPDGDVPLFNDAALIGRDTLELLSPEKVEPSAFRMLQPSGYAILRPSETLHMCVDVGPPCPPQLPAHAQADCLSFELAVAGRRIIVDTGTSTYAAGERRQYERSTPAHNTVTVDGADQTEVWGQFRAGRRADPLVEEYSETPHELTLVASHDGYRRLEGRPIHRRSFRVTAREVTLVDRIVGTGVHEAALAFHFAPGETVSAGADGIRIEPSGLRMQTNADASIDRNVQVASRFGVLEAATAVVATRRGALPLEFRTTFSIPDGVGGTA